MALFKRNSVWYMRFTYRGKQIKKSTETSDKKIAERIYQKLMGQIAEGKWFERLPGADKTFRELMEKYMREHSARNKAPISHIRDKSLSNHLTSFFGDLTLLEITISHTQTHRHTHTQTHRDIHTETYRHTHAHTNAHTHTETHRET